jgi:hypothetical protein
VRAETERRGSAYEGFWELLLPSFIGPGRVMRAQAIIRRERGILRMRMGVPVYESEGWLLPLEHHLYGVLVDPRVQAMQLMMLNGDVHPRVTLVDGIVMAGGSNRFMTPTAAAIVFQRKGNLTGDVDADDRTYTEAREAEQAFLLKDEEVPSDLRKRLFRDCGPEAAKLGGELLFKVPYDPSIVRGSLPSRRV